eukprot:1143953-Pelagomonas_calceolata.AAC.2
MDGMFGAINFPIKIVPATPIRIVCKVTLSLRCEPRRSEEFVQESSYPGSAACIHSNIVRSKVSFAERFTMNA